MVLKIAVDGYNLIRQSDELLHFESISLEEGRNGLIKLMAGYRRSMGHDITVVFDGWESDNIGLSKERKEGIDIIYSGRGERADEVIKRMSSDMRDALIVVSSDREIERHCVKNDTVVIASSEFEARVRMRTGDIYYGNYEDDDDEGFRGRSKKGPARKLSKEERRKRSKLEKL